MSTRTINSHHFHNRTLRILRHASGCQNSEEIIHIIRAEMRSVCACEPCHAFMVSAQGSLIAIIFCKGFIRWGQNIKHVSRHVRPGECEHRGMMLRLLSCVRCLSKQSINIALPQLMRNRTSLLRSCSPVVPNPVPVLHILVFVLL